MRVGRRWVGVVLGVAFGLVAVASDPPVLSEAERIAHAREAVASARKGIDSLQKRLDDPAGEYPKAEAEFQAADRKLKDARQAAAKLKAGGKADEAAKAEEGLPELQEDWQAARDRFDLAIRQRKVTREAIAGLQARAARDQDVLDRLEGRTPAAAPPPPAADAKPAPPAADHHDTPAVPTLPGVPGLRPAAAPTPAPAPAASPADADPVVRAAREAAAGRRAEARDADDRAKAAEERAKAMERSLKTAGQMAEIEKEGAAQAQKAAARLADTLRTRPPADPAERQVLTDRAADAEKRAADASDRARRIADRVAVLEETLKELRAEAAAAATAAKEATAAADAADREAAALLSPFTVRNLGKWAAEHGPNLLAILVGMVLVHLVARQFSRHIVQLVARDSHRGSDEDRENRASTLVGVFRYAAGVLVFGGGTVMLLDEVGVPVVPLMGGAAVLGLAVAFGAQNLIKDYFSGFMMLLEDQYSVNDVVRIGAVSGTVEQITLRVTVVRDLEGVRHVLPHGSIAAVSNLTHGWSRALFDVAVAYDEDVDRVIEVLQELAAGLRADPEFGPLILEDAQMLGVDALTDAGVLVKFFIKTRPLKQSGVRREMLRRIKNRFDREGIETPAQRRTVVHWHAAGEATKPRVA